MAAPGSETSNPPRCWRHQRKGRRDSCCPGSHQRSGSLTPFRLMDSTAVWNQANPPANSSRTENLVMMQMIRLSTKFLPAKESPAVCSKTNPVLYFQSQPQGLIPNTRFWTHAELQFRLSSAFWFMSVYGLLGKDQRKAKSDLTLCSVPAYISLSISSWVLAELGKLLNDTVVLVFPFIKV